MTHANRAIAAAEEAIEAALSLDHGDEDLLIDDGWVTDSDDDEDEDDMEDEVLWTDGDESDDDDDEEDELINLIGHV